MMGCEITQTGNRQHDGEVVKGSKKDEIHNSG